MHAAIGGHQRVLPSTVEEAMIVVLSLLPLMYIDFRSEASPVVTCSDASEEGNGVCVLPQAYRAAVCPLCATP